MFFTLQTVFPTLIFHFQFSILHLIKTVFTNWERRLAVRASDERPYGIVRTVAMLRSGIICLFTLQTVFPTLIFHFQFSILHLIKTVFTNWVRRHAVLADNIRPYKIAKTIEMLRSGIICFWALQTICTNGERRLAVTPCNSRLLVKNHALHYNISKR